MAKDVSNADKFRAKHADYVFGMIGLNDVVTTDIDQTDGVVYMCQELRCGEQKAHAHRKRPYLIYDRSKL